MVKKTEPEAHAFKVTLTVEIDVHFSVKGMTQEQAEKKVARLIKSPDFCVRDWQACDLPEWVEDAEWVEADQSAVM